MATSEVITMRTILALPLVFPIAAWRGYVFSILWGWFVVPFFHLPPVSIPQALGILIVSAMLTHQMPNEKQSEEETNSSLGYKISAGFCIPLVWLGFGWVVRYFL